MQARSIPEDALALVTGATGGIGKATCLALATLGCNIAVHYNSAASTAEALVSDLEKAGVKARAFQADLSQYEPTRKLHKEVAAEFAKSPDILFNNAGLTLGKAGVKDISEITVEDFEQTWRANCGTAFLLTQLCLPDMERRGWGRVVFCSSVAGFTGGVVGPHYAIHDPKQSVQAGPARSQIDRLRVCAYAGGGLLQSLELPALRQMRLSQDARCACLYASFDAILQICDSRPAPALISGTKMLPGENEELAKKIPLGRLGRPEEIAETVLWMVKTGYVTNKVIGVDGGMFAQ